MLLISIAVLAVAAYSQDVNPDIVYKYTSAYEVIWTDRGSGAARDGSIWRAQNYQSEYCSLGDVAADGHSTPTTKAVLVTAKTSGALVNPSSFTRVWHDGGSGADWDVAVYRMNAPSGYTCLGGVAMRSHSTQPDKSKYCCVKDDYVVQGDFMLAWNDVDSGADSDVSLWSVVRGMDAFGLDSGNFLPVNGYGAPSAGYLLRWDGVKVRDVWSLPFGEVKPLNLYELSETKMIWNDAGSGANADCSIWRAETRDGYYSLGDIVVASHSKPRIAYLAKPSNPQDHDTLRPPVSYSLIWRDSGSGADRDVAIWKANCPGGYVALGNVATSGGYPSLGDIYCVKSEYVSYGSNNANNWRYVWADHGSGADRDVAMYEAVASSSTQQTVRGFGSIASYHSYPGTPYLLNKEKHTYYAEKPIEKIYMYNVQYDLDAERMQNKPSKISPTVIENNSDRDQTSSRTIGFTLAESSTFTFSQAIQVSVAVELSAGIPAIGIGGKTTITATSTSTFTVGSTTTTTHSDSITATISLPARSRITAVVTGTEYKADIPYTASIRKVYYDGSQSYGTVSGVYKGVAVNEANVIYSEIEYFDGGEGDISQ